MSHMVARGTLYHVIARVLFVLSSYGMHIFVARYLGPNSYGMFGVILALIYIYRALVTTGFFQAVSKYTASYPSLAIAIRNKALQIQAIFSGSIFILVFAFASLIAKLLHTPELTYCIRLSSFVIPLMAVCYIYLGSLNGRRDFGKEALTIGLYSIARFAGIVLLVLMGLGVNGAVIGFIIAYGLSSIAAKNLNKLEFSPGAFSANQIIKFAFPVVVFSLGFGFLLNADILFVKSILIDNVKTGYYTSAVTISRMPYFILYSLLITLFPSVAVAYESGKLDLVKKYIKQAFRYMFMAIIPAAALLCATSKGLISLIYSPIYMQSAGPLSILIWGISFLVIFLVLTTVITAIGRPYISMKLILLLVPVDIILNLILIPKYELIGAALSTTITVLIGVIVAGRYVYQEFEVLVNPISTVKITLASGIIFLIAKYYPASGILLIAEYIILIVVYTLLMLLFKEINKEDIKILKGLLGSKTIESNQVNI